MHARSLIDSHHPRDAYRVRAAIHCLRCVGCKLSIEIVVLVQAYTGETLTAGSCRSSKIIHRRLIDATWVAGGAACTRPYG